MVALGVLAIGFLGITHFVTKEPNVGLSVFQISQGGTSTSTIPAYGEMLVGNALGQYDIVATSTLNISAGSYANFGTDFYTYFNATNTDYLSEGSSNRYMTEDGWAGYMEGTTTDALSEGSTNLYWSDTLFDNRLSSSTTMPFITTLLGLTNASTTQITVSGSAWLGGGFVSQASSTIDGALTVTGQITSTNIDNSDTATTTKLCFSNGDCMTSPTVSGSQITMFHWNESAEIATYEGLKTIPDSTNANTDESCSAESGTDGGYCTIDPYVSTTTPSGELTLTEIPAGTWEFHYFTYVSSVANASYIEATVYRRTSGGVETQMFQATSSEINNLSITEKQFISAQGAFAFDPTDRLVVKVQGYTDGAAAKDVHFLYGGTSSNYSHFHTPITIGSFDFASKSLDETISGAWTFSGNTTLTNASTTLLTVSGDTWLTDLGTAAGTFLAVDGAGLVIATTTSSGDPDQNLWETIAGDSGSTAADSTTDTLTIAGGTNITTAMSGDTLTINADDVFMLKSTTSVDSITTLTNLVTVGTIGSGTWEATDVGVEHGGTGASTFTDGGILLGSGTSAITAMAALNNGSIVVGDGTTDPQILAAFTAYDGDLRHEAGGLEADVSSYAGLLSITGGATAQVDSIAELNALLLGESVASTTWVGATSIVTVGTIGAGTWEGTAIAAGYYAAGSIDGDDINSNLAGRSLTLTGASPDTLDIDAEIYTGAITFHISSSTMSTSTTVSMHRFSSAVTITGAKGSCNTGTTTVNVEVRADATPYTAGTEVFGGGFPMGAGHTNSSSTVQTTAVAADVPFAFVIEDAEPTGEKSTECSLTIKYEKND